MFLVCFKFQRFQPFFFLFIFRLKPNQKKQFLVAVWWHGERQTEIENDRFIFILFTLVSFFMRFLLFSIVYFFIFDLINCWKWTNRKVTKRREKKKKKQTMFRFFVFCIALRVKESRGKRKKTVNKFSNENWWKNKKHDTWLRGCSILYRLRSSEKVCLWCTFFFCEFYGKLAITFLATEQKRNQKRNKTEKRKRIE